jgi:AcrR family transcriptional regulator
VTTTTRRTYDRTLRQARAAETHARIVDAGTALVRERSIGDWRGVTIRAVAARAGVSERTVYRHFTNERALRDAVMARLESESGVDLEHLTLGGVSDAAARIIRLVARTPPSRRAPADPTLSAANRRQHQALLAAVDAEAPGWSPAERRLAAAILDVAWSVGSYERLAVDWGLDRDEATRATTWLIDLVVAAVRADGRPPAA